MFPSYNGSKRLNSRTRGEKYIALRCDKLLLLFVIKLIRKRLILGPEMMSKTMRSTWVPQFYHMLARPKRPEFRKEVVKTLHKPYLLLSVEEIEKTRYSDT